MLRSLLGTAVILLGAALFFCANDLPLFPAGALVGILVMAAGYGVVTAPTDPANPAARTRALRLLLLRAAMLVLLLGGAILFLAGQSQERPVIQGLGIAMLAGFVLLRHLRARFIPEPAERTDG